MNSFFGFDTNLTNSGGPVSNAPMMAVSAQQQNDPFSLQSNEFQAALELLPPQAKADLLDAMASVPELVSQESPLERYIAALQNNNGNPSSNVMVEACQRLAFYWQLRREVFEEHAHKPLTMLPGGALSGEQELEVIHSGVYMMLPKDQAGRSAITVNASKFLPEQWSPHYRLARRRALFYFTQLISQNPVSQSQGAVWLGILVQGPPAGALDYMKRLTAVAMPVRKWNIHAVFPPNRYGTWAEFLPRFILQQLGLGSFVFPKNLRVRFYSGDSDEIILQELQAEGCARRRLPVSIGGEWDAHDSWIKRQLKDEETKFLTQEEKDERKRNQSIQRSRDKRKRQRDRETELRQKHQDLKTTNSELQNENQRLEALLRHAQDEVAFLAAIDDVTN